MKSITVLMLVMILLTSFYLSAQTVGVTAGATFSTVKVKSDNVSGSPKTRTGITGGIFTNIPLSSHVSFQPALNFVQKGYIVKVADIGKETVNFNYLELPLNFVYSQAVSTGLFIGAGLSFAYGLSGNDRFEYDGGNMPEENDKVHFGSGADRVKAFDFGANFILGYQFKKHFLITGNYNIGLSKINNPDPNDGNGSIKNNYFGVKIGYVSGKGKRSK